MSEYLRKLPQNNSWNYAPTSSKSWTIDFPLLIGLLLVMSWGWVVLYSASDIDKVYRQAIHFGIGFISMMIVAQIPLDTLRRWSIFLFIAAVVLLSLVLLIGDHAKGAQRWLEIPGVIRFQPSEIAKLAVPLFLTHFFCGQMAGQPRIPPSLIQIFIAFCLISIPATLIGMQPDLGTAIIISCSGILVLFFSGLRWRWILACIIIAIPSSMVLWKSMYEYQRRRVLTFLDPESDPLGAGWNIIQSQTAIGSGGLTGKGWMAGTQSRLDFLPESSTDFIYAVLAEEFGLQGVLLLLALYAFVVARGFMLAWSAPKLYGRILAATLTATFLMYIVINVGMVSGLLPVVGVPLPLISYGGTSVVTLMTGFGLIMASKQKPL
ncbi:MAG: rod shape-determining protein RodA, partial [Pseudomonadota bacterium]